MRFKDESSSVALGTLLFCDNFSLNFVLLKFEFLWLWLRSCYLPWLLLLLITLWVDLQYYCDLVKQVRK